MTHAVIWIDHKEARIFHVHPEAAAEDTVSRRSIMFTAIQKGVGRRESIRVMRIGSSMTSRVNSTALMPS